MKKRRYLHTSISKDLKSKMVFVGGARQAGKTTLALSLLKARGPNHPGYLNWDIPLHKEKLLNNKLPLSQKLLVFDEFHKFAFWRNTMKGLYDMYHQSHSFLVTGSARLDYFSKGGDSLLGRYHYYRLHPFSLYEINPHPTRSDLKNMLRFGSFPEPFLKQSKTYLKRWLREKKRRVIYEDLRDLQQVKEVSLIALLMENLPQKVGSPLSIKSLREDLNVSHQTVERWINILQHMYLVFQIPPYGGTSPLRTVKKEKKLYLYDWPLIENQGIRFENLVACHLLKYCHFIEDTKGDNMELKFLRDTSKREIDFVVIKNKKPLLAVECKSGESAVSPHIKYFRERTKIPMWFQVHTGKQDFGEPKKSARVLPFHTFCKSYLKV